MNHLTRLLLILVVIVDGVNLAAKLFNFLFNRLLPVVRFLFVKFASLSSAKIERPYLVTVCGCQTTDNTKTSRGRRKPGMTKDK